MEDCDQSLEADQLKQAFQPVIVQRPAHDAAEKTDVLPHCLPWQENAVLEYETYLTIAAESFRLLTGDLDNPRCRGNQISNNLEEGCLATPAWTNQGYELLLPHIQRDWPQASVSPCLDSYVNETSRAAIRISPKDAATSCVVKDDSCVNKVSTDRHCKTSIEACSSLDRGQRLREHYSPVTPRAPHGHGQRGCRRPNWRRCSSSSQPSAAAGSGFRLPNGRHTIPKTVHRVPALTGWFVHRRRRGAATGRLSADQ